MKKRVIEYVSTMDVGGIESFVKDICITLDKEKYDVMLISVRGRKETPNEQALDGVAIEIHYLFDEIGADNNERHRVRALLNDRRCTLYLLQIVNNFKPDIIHVHGNEARIAKIIHFIPHKTKIYIHVHSEPKKAITELGRVSDIKRILKYREGRLIALQSKFAEEVDEIIGVRGTLVLPNCVDLERFKVAINCRENTREEINIEKDAFVVGHIGIFRSVKNHSFLIDVFKSIVRKNKKAFLLLIGEGELEKDIRNKLHEAGLDEKYLILKRRGDVPNLLAAMDVYVMPSIYEGFPISLIEAQAVGLKCVVSDSITTDAFVTDKVVPVSLKESADEWANKVLNKNICCNSNNNLDALDKKNVVKRLEEIYES